MGKTYRFEIVNVAEYELVNMQHDENEPVERDRLKAHLNALGAQGFRFVHYHKLSSTIWLQKEIAE